MSDWQGFYTVSEVSRLARVPRRTLYSWQNNQIIAPSLETPSGQLGYSYADLTIVRLLRAVREHRIDFRSASFALRHLYERLGPPSAGWSKAQVFFEGRHVYAYLPDDDWEITAATKRGQKVEPVLLGDAFAGIKEEIADLGDDESVVVPREFRPYVNIDPAVRGGEPVVKGTRIPTSVVASLRDAGSTVAQIARMYRGVTRRVVEGVVAYERFLDAPPSRARAPAT